MFLPDLEDGLGLGPGAEAFPLVELADGPEEEPAQVRRGVFGLEELAADVPPAGALENAFAAEEVVVAFVGVGMDVAAEVFEELLRPFFTSVAGELEDAQRRPVSRSRSSMR
ncbi:MAG: hypothetical protein WC789_05115 [Lentisphaeria bacterium]|jgi:hypothetical protein